jgi:hypothetical protein
MKKMLVVVGLVTAVSVVCGWDQVKRSIYELTAHTVIADVATVGALTATTIGGTAQATVLAGAAAGGTAYQPGSAIAAAGITANQNVAFDDTNNVARTFSLSDEYKIIATPRILAAVTNGQSLGAVNSYYSISAAGAVTCAVDNASAAGMQFTIINTSAQPITFADSGNLALSGAAVLDQYDTLTLYAIATNMWVEIAQQDN